MSGIATLRRPLTSTKTVKFDAIPKADVVNDVSLCLKTLLNSVPLIVERGRGLGEMLRKKEIRIGEVCGT